MFVKERDYFHQKSMRFQYKEAHTFVENTCLYIFQRINDIKVSNKIVSIHITHMPR